MAYFLGYRVLVPMGVDSWMQYRLPANAPRIAFSPNDTWLEELGANEAIQNGTQCRISKITYL